jgi:hypothetical protein
MAPARPQRKSSGKSAAEASRRHALLLALAAFLTIPAAAATERVVVDWHTGLALYGYDPVAYFTDAKPLMGRPDVEYPLAGAIWRFRNEGNRQAFIAHTDIYMPRYGGYDPIAIARGVAKPGHPDWWLLDHDRLYLFADARTRAAFGANAAAATAAADEKWPAVRHALVP